MKIPIIISLILAILIAIAVVTLLVLPKKAITEAEQLEFDIIKALSDQSKVKAQSQNEFFEDNLPERPRIAGTVARGEWSANPMILNGTLNGQWAAVIPIKITPSFTEQGKKQYAVFCASCHGDLGEGDGPVALHTRKNSSFDSPPSITGKSITQKPVGYYFNLISKGGAKMPAFSGKISPQDRWAILSYIKSL